MQGQTEASFQSPQMVHVIIITIHDSQLEDRFLEWKTADNRHFNTQYLYSGQSLCIISKKSSWKLEGCEI